MLVMGALQTQLLVIMQQELQEDRVHSQQSLQLVVVVVEDKRMEIHQALGNLVVLEVVVDMELHQMPLEHHQDQE
jgi:hypothetical protein